MSIGAENPPEVSQLGAKMFPPCQLRPNIIITFVEKSMSIVRYYIAGACVYGLDPNHHKAHMLLIPQMTITGLLDSPTCNTCNNIHQVTGPAYYRRIMQRFCICRQDGIYYKYMFGQATQAPATHKYSRRPRSLPPAGGSGADGTGRCVYVGIYDECSLSIAR
jgi:hypothetical protein